MTLHPLLADLNEKQCEAVAATDGAVLVIAGAGSGKTRALTHRIAYLIQEKHVRPGNILAVTFTNKAAGEMRERVIRLLGIQPPTAGADQNFVGSDMPTIGTFHSVCVRILRKHIHLMDYENQFVIYDTSDQLILMKHVFEDLKINEKEINPKAVLGHISNAKNKLIGPKEFSTMAQSYFEEKTARLYQLYQDRLKKNNALDFDDLLMKTVELLRTHPEVLTFYQEKFRYVHVDEYQDTNHAQYILTNLLAAKYRNLCVIGDHDQSIYSWRGATLQNILDFEKDYPEAKVIKLEQNYRSTQFILDAAQAVIVKNRRRQDKELWTERDGGDKIRLWVAENERHEGELVASAIRDAVRGHETADYRDFVLLYRTNAQSRVLEEVFMRYGIPYKIIGGIRFYQRKEIKDVVAYLRVIANPADSVSLLRVINNPPRQIGPKTLEVLQNFANIKDCSFFEAMHRVQEVGEETDFVSSAPAEPDASRSRLIPMNPPCRLSGSCALTETKREKIEKFFKLIRHLQKLNTECQVAALIKYVIDESGYKKFLDDGTIEGEARLENVAELVSVASKYDKLEPGVSLSIFLEEISLLSDLDSMDEKDNAVTLMTLHSAKGLEFPWVFICGLEEGLLPHSQSMLSPEQLEEERRLFYVGCTRAMDRLHLIHTKNRMLYGESHDVIPSQFLSDIPEDLTESNAVKKPNPRYAVDFGFKGGLGNKPIPTEIAVASYNDGDRVMHTTFGEGMVISTVGGIITVAFKNPKFGIKKLAITIAPLEKI